jgi:hypothetical protein
MQRENASACWTVVDWASADARAADLAAAGDAVPACANAGTARLAAARTVAAARVVGDHGRDRGRVARVVSFILSSSEFDDRGRRRCRRPV